MVGNGPSCWPHGALWIEFLRKDTRSLLTLLSIQQVIRFHGKQRVQQYVLTLLNIVSRSNGRRVSLNWNGFHPNRLAPSTRTLHWRPICRWSFLDWSSTRTANRARCARATRNVRWRMSTRGTPASCATRPPTGRMTSPSGWRATNLADRPVTLLWPASAIPTDPVP